MGEHMMPHLEKSRCGSGAEVGVTTAPAPHLLGGVGVVREQSGWWWRSGAEILSGGGHQKSVRPLDLWTGAQPKITQSQIKALAWSMWPGRGDADHHGLDRPDRCPNRKTINAPKKDSRAGSKNLRFMVFRFGRRSWGRVAVAFTIAPPVPT